jgi:hypothetical protein
MHFCYTHRGATIHKQLFELHLEPETDEMWGGCSVCVHQVREGSKVVGQDQLHQSLARTLRLMHAFLLLMQVEFFLWFPVMPTQQPISYSAHMSLYRYPCK